MELQLELNLSGLCGPQGDNTDDPSSVAVTLFIEHNAYCNILDWWITDIEIDNPPPGLPARMDKRDPLFKAVADCLTAGDNRFIEDRCAAEYDWRNEDSSAYVTGRAA